MRMRFHWKKLFPQKIIFSDDAHFQIDGCVDKQNCGIYERRKSGIIHEKPSHTRITVWRALYVFAIIRWIVGIFFACNES